MTRVPGAGGVGAFVLAALVVGCGGSIGSTAPSTSAIVSPSPSPVAEPSFANPEQITPSTSQTPVPIQAFSQTFTSPTMGFSVDYPEGWTTFNASKPWVPGELETWDAPNGDRIESSDAGFRGGSQALPAGQTGQEWIDAYMATEPTGCGEREQIPLADTQATIGLNGCRGLGRLGGRVYDLVLVKDGRAYNFTMEGAIDRAFLLAILATVKLDPASAID